MEQCDYLVFHDVNEYLVLNEVTIHPGHLAFRVRFNALLHLDQLVLEQTADLGAQHLAVELEQLGQVLLAQTGKPDEHVHDQRVLESVKAARHQPRQLFQTGRHVC